MGRPGNGIHFSVRMEEDRTCILVLMGAMGATAEGSKELIAVQDDYRESEQSWKSLLLDVKQRGLTVDPELATGDGALGFKLAESTQKKRRRLNGRELIGDLIAGTNFTKGVKSHAA